MRMPVVHVRIMRVAVNERLVHVEVRMGLGPVRDIVRVVMMFVMNVSMRVFEVLVRVLVRMAFGDMEPHSKRHQYARDD